LYASVFVCTDIFFDHGVYFYLFGYCTFFLYRLFDVKHNIGIISYVTWGAFVGLSILLEIPSIIYALMVCCFVVFFLLIYSAQYHTSEKQHIYKPIRRMIMMLLVFDAYAYLSTVFALILFFPVLPLWVWGILGVCIYVFITGLIWRLYFDVKGSSLLLWLLLVGVIMLELFWVFQFFPFGYLVSAFLLTWLWYILQLFLRFYLSTQGVIWKKQREFLLINGLLYVLMLVFIVRWI